MLTCKVGENSVNTIDYEDSQLRKWHDKNILKCPYCDGLMHYRHGEIKVAYFAHQPGSDCTIEIIGNEPETDEHRQSIKDIYLWLKENKEISDIILESWIPETKQRPDITFIYKDIKYAIEMQCSPLATEYLERHRLYKLSEIKDIWILGIDKYKDNLTTDGFYKTKTIERQLIYDENQQLMYYSCKNKIMKIISEGEAEAILDRKTTFKLHAKNIKLNQLNIDEILQGTFYQENRDTLYKLFEDNIKNKCDKIEYDYYIKSLDKRVLMYFEKDNKKYIIDYVSEYLHLESYQLLMNEYDKIGIKPFIFLNYDFYSGLLENTCFEKDNYCMANSNYLEFKKCIDSNMLFVYKDKIKLFTNEDIGSNIDILINEKINEYIISSPLYYIRKEFIKYENYETNINYEAIKRQIVIYTDNIIERVKLITLNRKFKTFDIKDIIFSKGLITDKCTGNNLCQIMSSKENIYDKLFKNNIEWATKKIDKDNEKIRINKDLFERFKIKINMIFKNNKDIITTYDRDYSIILKDEEGNKVSYDNLIYFEESNQKYIIHSDEYILHNSEGIQLTHSYNTDIIFINLYNIDRFVNNKWIFVRNYYGALEIKFIDDIRVKVKYEYPKIFENKTINLFYNHKYKKIKKDVDYHYLPRYNFVDFTEIIKTIYSNIIKLICEINKDINDNIDSNKIYNNEDFNVSIKDEEIDKTIINSLYPISIIANKEEHEKVNIMLNPTFTMENKKFRLWLVKDYIETLDSIGIENIYNIKDGYYVAEEDNIADEKNNSI